MSGYMGWGLLNYFRCYSRCSRGLLLIIPCPYLLMMRSEIFWRFFAIMWSNVETWVLGVRGVLGLEDRAGDVGVKIVRGFAVRVAVGEVAGWFGTRVAFAEFAAWFAAREDVTVDELVFALWEASLKRTLVIRFFEGILRVVVLI